MLNKVFAGFIVVFWVAMMTALVRVEFFPQPLELDRYPTRRVLKKIFANPAPARLNVYYRGAPVGLCQIDIHPKLNGEPAETLLPGQQPDAYEVTSMLQMTLSVFGMPSRLVLRGRSTFNADLDLEDFHMTTGMNGGRVTVTGDHVTKKVNVVLDFGDVHDERTFDFNQIQGVGFASAFGMPGLASVSLTGDGGSPRSADAVGVSDSSHPRAMTATYFDRLEVAGSRLRVFLIYSKVNEQVWTKIWVSETDGEVLKVSTSLGLEMVSNVLKVSR